mmetsp:Transcript_34646/g.82167  ORF Transcript_34646/g.82167 Transcript_34646/m.82167 type:complete len:161 (+) Transcript_34646:153-635(+)
MLRSGKLCSVGLSEPKPRVAIPGKSVRPRASSEPQAADTSVGSWEFCLTKEALLKSPNQRAQGDIPGIGKVAVFWFKGKPVAVQGQCPHLGIPLAGGKLTPEGKLVCSQHKSSWKVESGEVEEWLPGNFINAFQRVISPACPLETFECKIEDESIFVKVP